MWSALAASDGRQRSLGGRSARRDFSAAEPGAATERLKKTKDGRLKVPTFGDLLGGTGT